MTNINDLLREYVTLTVECLDRVYLNGYIPTLQTAGQVDKTANPATVYLGHMVTYTYTVTNPGDALLSSVTLSDDRCSPVTRVGGDSDIDNRLDPSETWIYHCAMALSADITNTVTVTGTYSLNGTVSSADTLSVDVISPGDDPLSDMSLSDNKCSPVTLMESDSTSNYRLDPGEIWLHTCPTVLNIDTTNTATATGIGSAGNPVNATDIAFVAVQQPEEPQYPIFLPIVLKNY